MTLKVKCFLPCRKGSERVPRKNIKPFAGHEFGLIEVKLKQLCAAERIESVVLSTNDDEILDYAANLGQSKIILHRRDETLSSSATSTDALVGHVLDLIPDGHVLWTHVTSPFVTARHYDQMIEAYAASLAEGFDSLMSTTPIHGFLWQDGKPINYDRSVEKWPRTQTLAAVHEVNSAAFIAAAAVYREQADRIGQKPLLFGLDKLVSHDVDWPEDFVLAECLAEKGLVGL